MIDDVGRAMLVIKTLDDDAHLLYSKWTHGWYVTGKIEVSNGIIMRGPCEHRDTPNAAVLAYLDHLQSISFDEVIVAYHAGERREYRWSGAAFAEEHGSIRERARERT